MSELAKMIARIGGIQPGKEFWQEFADFLRFEDIADDEITPHTRKWQEVYGIADDVRVRMQILATLARIANPETLAYIVNRMINDTVISHEDFEFLVTKLENIQ
ncbi:MAG: hypothetical protein KAR20_25990, partial [Candidatus Heimdallarchaeota archaeon]|nr:hypothetical protein [Candidatus Heimdallarchaeota archaeon]